ncbi:hypothetical protein [Salinibacter ruber]|uniref:Uncharacterized protein n=1 Tax=Salinibacter ruber TaxID=146919 RepID=A0A9X2RA18_9BACT|nr:hypothetical protein [Salinibacter ruber]MCS3611455.1 hypothetical protein [Salinibacter ruber]MCS3615487.1 hypothetical protein [Salinibacter ruber]MCS3647980.1 hypothetical protein [Salinibacter ruber]MCS3673995.1 hypothetical protein [Salinibacter ruber]MCS3784918.1 hypothetical protein [Salinibacter ruber]
MIQFLPDPVQRRLRARKHQFYSTPDSHYKASTEDVADGFFTGRLQVAF